MPHCSEALGITEPEVCKGGKKRGYRDPSRSQIGGVDEVAKKTTWLKEP